MKVTLRTLVLAAIVFTLVALPTVALAAGGQPVTAAVSTVLTAAGETGLGYWPPPPPPPGPPHYPPPYHPPHCGAGGPAVAGKSAQRARSVRLRVRFHRQALAAD